MRLQPAPAKTKGTIFDLLLTLFVDDTAMIADTRDDLILAADELRTLFRRFGLLMHVGERNPDGTWTKSKTEALFCPASAPENADDAVPEPAVLPGGQFRVEYTKEFKYLGSFLTGPLTDEVEIEKRLRKAKNQMGGLLTFFRSPADLETKRLVFQAIPLNTALYGCESWTMPVAMQRKLSVFFHSSLRRILKLGMKQVETFRIRNAHLRNKFNLPDILETLHYRQARFLGSIARRPDTHLQWKFLSAWIMRPRSVGRPQHTLRHLHVDTLRLVLGDEGCLPRRTSQRVAPARARHCSLEHTRVEVADRPEKRNTDDAR